MNEIPELLERYRRGAELVAVAITGAAGPELDFKPAPEKWSVRQIVAHLADAEAANVVRLRQVISEDSPTLVPFDQNAWAERTDYHKRKPSQSLETMRQLRGDNFQLLSGLPSDAFSRTATHLKRGDMTLSRYAPAVRRTCGKSRHADSERPRGIQGITRERGVLTQFSFRYGPAFRCPFPALERARPPVSAPLREQAQTDRQLARIAQLHCRS